MIQNVHRFLLYGYTYKLTAVSDSVPEKLISLSKLVAIVNFREAHSFQIQ